MPLAHPHVKVDSKDYVPTRFNTNTGQYVPLNPKRTPRGASPDWPNWRCKNACGRTFPEDFEGNKCPTCRSPLIRWVRYEVKK